MRNIFWGILMVGLVAGSAQAKLVTKTIEYKHGNVVLEGYLAYDDAVKGARPGVLVAHEWWGHNAYVRSRAEQLAGLGYTAFALDMYGKGVMAADAGKAGELAGAFYKDFSLMRARAQAGLDVLKAQKDLVDPQRVAAIGYCFGGTTVLQLAYSGAEVAGVVSFHGGVVSPDSTDRIKAKLLVLHGAADTFIKPEAITDFDKTMTTHKADWQFISYSGAVHAFTNPKADDFKIPGVAYQAAADKRSWQHMRDFFNELFLGK